MKPIASIINVCFIKRYFYRHKSLTPYILSLNKTYKSLVLVFTMINLITKTRLAQSSRLAKKLRKLDLIRQ